MHMPSAFRLKKGALAHLARALDWQSKGDRFESDMLHIVKRLYGRFFVAPRAGKDAFFCLELLRSTFRAGFGAFSCPAGGW